MKRHLFKRCLAAIPLLIGVVTLVFLLLHLLPGDPVDMMLGENAQAADRQALRAALGLNLPLWRQYFFFWHTLFFENWGQSLLHHCSVLPLIWERFPATLALALAALAIACLIALPLGVWAARRAGSLEDVVLTLFALLTMSLPIFVLGPLLILLFAMKLELLPVSGGGDWRHLLLPALCLGLAMSGPLLRLVRTSLLETLGEEYIRTARAKGLRERKVLFVHALRNALLPVLTVLGDMLGALLAGAVIIESIFDWPGIGRLFYLAFQSRDYPLVQGIVLWTAATSIFITLAIDILYTWVDPRIQVERA